MSKPLAIAAAASIFATSALALFAPGSARPSDPLGGTPTTLAAPSLSAALPFPR